MDVKEYIESGILELYVMGALDPQEAAEVERYAVQYPEIREELRNIEGAGDSYIQSLSVPPPAHLKAKTLRAATGNSQPTEPRPQAKTIPMQPARSNALRYIAIAASVALIVSVLFNYVQYDSNRSLQSTLVKQQKQIESLNKDYDKVYTAYYKLEDKMNMMASPDNRMVHMMGMKNSDVATIVWNPKNKEVYLAVNQLIEPPSGKQYQLWAIVDNQPVDLGVFDPDMKSYEMIRMKDVENASAFAVTVEKEGGSPVPTMEAMWLMGGV